MPRFQSRGRSAHSEESGARAAIHKSELAAKIDAQNARFEALRGQLTCERRILWPLVDLLGIAVLRSLIAG